MEPVTGMWWKFGLAFVAGVATGIAAEWAIEKHQQGVLMDELKKKAQTLNPMKDEPKKD